MKAILFSLVLFTSNVLYAEWVVSTTILNLTGSDQETNRSVISQVPLALASILLKENLTSSKPNVIKKISYNISEYSWKNDDFCKIDKPEEVKRRTETEFNVIYEYFDSYGNGDEYIINHLPMFPDLCDKPSTKSKTSNFLKKYKSKN